MKFRIITHDEYPLIRDIHTAAIEAGEYLTLAPQNSEQIRKDYWFGDKPEGEVWIVEENGAVLGSYYQRPNHYGYGGHIANGGYIVSPEAKGKGVGRRLGEHSLARAREKGYRGMQYNFVVSTNTVAVKLWQSLGFTIIATIPGGYHRKGQEYVDAYVMFQDLR
jgi:ribosomal protein S18 acetylase RimI-like enzyme